MAGIKIVDLPALGRDLISTDLLELSLAGGTGSRKITGQEIMNASKLSVGNTPIINGAVGQVLFQGTGNVLQESANLFWDNTNGRFGIGTSSPLRAIDVFASNPEISTRIATNGTGKFSYLSNAGGELASISLAGASGEMRMFASSSYFLTFYSSNAERIRIPTTGNVLINTTTDAGYKLDVNGTARVNAQLEVNSVNSTQGILLKHFALATTATQIYYNSPDAITYFDALYSYTASSSLASYNFRTKNSSNALTSRLFIQGWDGNVGIGTSSPSSKLHVIGSGNTSATTSLLVQQSTGVNVLSVRDDMYVTVQNTNNSECFQVRGANDDATIRFTPNGGTSSIVLRSQSSSITLSTTANSFGDLRVSGGGQTLRIGTSSASGGGINYYSSQNGAVHSHRWFHNNVEQMSLQYTGNFLIGTTTDAGFRLDVNGTARISGDLSVPTGKITFQTSAFGIDCNTTTGVFDIRNNLGSLQNTRISFSQGTYLNIYQPTQSSTGITSGIINTISTPITYAWSSGTAQSNLFVLNPTINNTGTYSGTFRGFYYNPNLVSMTGTTHFAIHTTAGRVRFEGLPTSPTGLNAGDIYNDGGTLKIV